MSNVITIEDVREEMLDRQAEDHLVLADLAFTDTDIEWAMKSCARKFNSIRPLGIEVCWDGLPINSSVFLDGVSLALYKRWLRNVSVNEFDYDAGGVKASVQGALRANLTKVVEHLEHEFLEAATALKTTINAADAWGPVG